MNSTAYLRFVLLSIVLIALQLWVLSPIALFRVATPFLYPLLLLALPIGASRVMLTIAGFAIGMVIDVLGGTPGLHASALTVTAFSRNYLLAALTDKYTLEDALPTYKLLHGGAVILLALLLALHHVVLFALVSLRLFSGWHLLLCMAASWAFSFVLSLIGLLFFGVESTPRK